MTVFERATEDEKGKPSSSQVKSNSLFMHKGHWPTLQI